MNMVTEQRSRRKIAKRHFAKLRQRQDLLSQRIARGQESARGEYEAISWAVEILRPLTTAQKPPRDFIPIPSQGTEQ